MANRNYTAEDYLVCHEIWNQRSAGMRAPVDDLGNITVARVDRARLLRLVDGPANKTFDGELVRLSGLGWKTAAEARRLGKTS